MDELTVRIVGRAKRRTRWAYGGFTVVWGALGVAALVATLRDGKLAEILIVGGIFLLVWLPAGYFMTVVTAGNTRIGPAGLQLRGLFARGFIAWGEVVEITDRFHRTRGTGWWSVEAQLVTGRVRRLPGFYCEGPVPNEYTRPKREDDFEAQLTEVRRRFRHWQEAG